MTQSSTIHIKIGAVEVTCEGPVDRDYLAGVLQTIKAEAPEWVEAKGGDDGGMKVGDLLARSAAKTFGDKAGVIAYWLEEHQGRGEWRSGDVLDVLRELGEPEPANITDALNQKLRKGLFAVSDRRWKLTGEGRGWVKYALLGDGESSGQL